MIRNQRVNSQINKKSRHGPFERGACSHECVVTKDTLSIRLFRF